MPRTIRMRLRLATLVLGGIAVLYAADPAGLVYWPKGVPPAEGRKGAKFDTHSLGISHRDKDGVAEVHENQTDVMVVQSGEATLVAGGEAVNPKTVSPGEMRGDSIRNGTQMHLSAGDIVHVPAGMPHQFLLEPGKQITYFVIKVDRR